MKTLTLEEIKALEPCWLETAEGREKFRRIGSRKEQWTALDVLELPKEDVSSEDKLWLVLREEFLSARTLYLFACEVAEQALSKIDNPDPRSVEAIRVKRLWIDGKATNEELDAAGAAARAAARDAERYAAEAAARDAERYAAEAAARDAERYAAWYAAEAAARDAAEAAARDAARAAARDAAWAAAEAAARAAAGDAAWAAARDDQVQTLLKIIKEENN